ncbi:oligopeptide ABC transporter permease [Fusibacter ferrireducens]|uniref:ABC transporter permease n=1 Tax=Fusibacter ferrireducens TaxID=2785058 RepID=A0ABR9ZUS1_9FIRM|nr:oligopeptide ABC transporter permease [Fusibacter ferrireducens]MBF4694212.1 ABC transporter permease [Fusibacter ferrireducens]
MSLDKSVKSQSPWQIGFERLKKNRLAMIGFTLLCIVVTISVFAPLLTSYDRDAIDTLNSYQKPSAEHWLGTDELGRDTFTRLLYGGRISLSVGLVSTSIAVLIGVILGTTGGYHGGHIDNIIMRIVDIFMCFPFFLIAIVVAAILGPSIWNVMIISGILGWTGIARIVRAEVLSLKEREFIEAARALGLNSRDIIIKHIIPNIMAPIIVYATLGIARGILSEAGLSFLGLGVKPPTPSWGNMLAAAQSMRSLRLHWWLWIPPGCLVFFMILSINFLGDGLRDALDPKLKQ